MSFNTKLSYTEHAVVSPTTDFAIGFTDYGLPSDTINVFVDDVLATEAGYTVTRKNNMVVELQPAVASGVVRLQRATNLDASFYRFTAGAKFVAANIDTNFNQILHSQQETRDGFDKLAGDVYPLVDGLEVALSKADEASKAAQDAADAAEEAAQATRSASQVNDASGETQQQVNYNGGSKWHSRVGGYKLNDRVVLTNGDIVKSTVSNNTNDPNVNMTGWVNPKLEQEKKSKETVSTADYGSVGKAQNIPVSDWYTSGSANFRGYANLAAVQVDYPHVLSATNTVDWAAAQKACNVQKKHGAIKIVGCLFFKQGETLSTKAGQRLYGLNSGWFANTNNGTAFTGSLTGALPEYGIYYDGTTGTALSCEASTQLEGFHLFGKGLVLTDGSVNILDIKDAEFYDTVGVEIKQSITTNNLSVYYFGTAFKTIGGNYYSRFNTTEVTRCSTAYKYSVTAYNQDFYGCVIRNTCEPFLFDADVACPNFSFFGGSIEGFRSKISKEYAIGVPANSSMQFIGTYFENLDTGGVFEAAFGFLGGNTEIRFLGCMIYLNHFNSWVKQNAFNKITVSSKNNRFFLSNSSRSKNPIIYNVIFIENSSYLDVDGSDRINFALSVPYSTKTGSIASGSTSLTLNDVTDVYVGQRIRIASPVFQTIVKSITGNVVTLQTAPTFSHNGIVEIYLTPQYVSFDIGTGLLNNDLIYPRDYLARFDSLEFRYVSGSATKSLTKAPSNPFSGGNNGVATYVADYANWNPSGKSDGRGAYPVAYRGGKYYPQLGSFTGSFTCIPGSLTIVNDTNVSASSVVSPVPRNAAAANLLKNGYYISETSNSTRFSIMFLTSAVGTEKFDYTITD